MMPPRALAICLLAFFLALFLQRGWISWMRRLKIGQAIKRYGPEAHMKKAGTPSMGGVVALAVTPPVLFLAARWELAAPRDLLALWAYPFIAASVGLLDDVLKFLSRSSEGLKSLSKLVLQFAVSAPFAFWLAGRGLYWFPGAPIVPYAAVPLFMFLGVGIQNAVNVTDGLDGLAAGTAIISLIACLMLFGGGAAGISAAVAIAILAAFLWHNANPAAVFMGDVGAHFWAGLLIGICAMTDHLILVVPLAFLFGIEIISVAIQIVAIRGFGRKVFKMSPLHHHFELLGWSEPKIVARFWLVHAAGMVSLLAILLQARAGGA